MAGVLSPNTGHVVTRWIMVVFFPIVPIRSYAIDSTKKWSHHIRHCLCAVGLVRDVFGDGHFVDLLASCNQYVSLCILAVGDCSRCRRGVDPALPGSVSWLMAALSAASWFFAAIMMRTPFRAPIVRSKKLHTD